MAMHDPEQGRLLITMARDAIARALGEPPSAPGSPPSPQPAWLAEPGAVFVTLTKHGQLRGCIGSLEAQRPLAEDVRANARAAAFDDPRFPPLDEGELADTRVEVSILSHPEPMRFTGEADALSQLRPGIDGVILEYGWHRATFLPQVWEQLPEPRHFLGQLKLKAGLSPEFWAEGVRLSRYTVEKFKEGSS
jgi:AmmeMemoRadiSam system protein A